MAIVNIALYLAVAVLSCYGYPQRSPASENHAQHLHAYGPNNDQSQVLNSNGYVKSQHEGTSISLPGNGIAYLMGGYSNDKLAEDDERGKNSEEKVVTNNKPEINKPKDLNTQGSPGFVSNNGFNGQDLNGSPNQGNAFNFALNNGTGSPNQGPQHGPGGFTQGSQNKPIGDHQNTPNGPGGDNQGSQNGAGIYYQGPQNGPAQRSYNQGGYNNGPYRQNGYSNAPQTRPVYNQDPYNQGQGYNNGLYNAQRNNQGGYINQGGYNAGPYDGPGGYNQGSRGYTPFNQRPGTYLPESFNGQADFNVGDYRGSIGIGPGYEQNPNAYNQNVNTSPNHLRTGYSQQQDGHDQLVYGQNSQGHRRPTSFAKGGRTFTKGGNAGQNQNHSQNYGQNVEPENQGNRYVETTTSIASKLHDVELLPASTV